MSPVIVVHKVDIVPYKLDTTGPPAEQTGINIEQYVEGGIEVTTAQASVTYTFWGSKDNITFVQLFSAPATAVTLTTTTVVAGIYPLPANIFGRTKFLAIQANADDGETIYLHLQT